ncbi:GNAT family N-acetyltransferase [Kitasatospora sp. NPDC053057]|uniref:GNAT family N-acetyltransferase n=1 Tax=Kitasatospora sp. NPDC053057 TaxID=3364062 RepID=UPI0037C851CF
MTTNPSTGPSTGPSAAPNTTSAAGLRITAMRPEHADAVLAIFQAGIDVGNATFETTAPTWDAFDAAKLPEHRVVALDADTPGGDRVLGWAAVSRVSSRRAYAGVVEHSVYVDPAAQGRGVGRALLDALLASTDAAGIWTVQSGIFPENTASLALHRRAGFRMVGTRERIGRLHGRWRDVVMVERRSPAVD